MKKKFRILLLVLLALGSSGLYFWARKIDLETFATSIVALLALSPVRIFGYRNLDKEVTKLRKDHEQTEIRYAQKQREFQKKYDNIAQQMQALEDSALLIKREIDSLESGSKKTPYTEEEILNHLRKYQ